MGWRAGVGGQEARSQEIRQLLPEQGVKCPGSTAIYLVRRRQLLGVSPVSFLNAVAKAVWDA